MTTDERTVAAFELSDLGVDHAQYFQGAGVAFTDWDEVFVGVGDTAREAAADAVENAATHGWNVPSELENDMDYDISGFDGERSAHDDCGCECPPNDLNECLGDCHDECEMQHYAALYVRYE